jgi:hypothetical protein
MPDPVQLEIAAHAGLWRLSEAGAPGHSFSRLEDATHEAVRRARELADTGEPAEVWVEAAHGKRLRIDVDPEVTQEQERTAPDTPIDVAAERA